MVTACRCYRQVFQGQPDQVSQVRHTIAERVRNTPVADNLVLIASELAANAVLHSRSRGGTFTVACEVMPGYVWLAVEDLGGEWLPQQADGRCHGLEIVALLATRWGIEQPAGGSRVVWASVEWRRDGTRAE